MTATSTSVGPFRVAAYNLDATRPDGPRIGVSVKAEPARSYSTKGRSVS